MHIDESNRRGKGGGGGIAGDAARLVNGKAKTADVKQMWTHPYSHGDTLIITFTLPTHVLPLSKIKVWNYNGIVHVR